MVTIYGQLVSYTDAFKNPTLMVIKSTDGTLLYQEKNTYNARQSLISKEVCGSMPETVESVGTYNYTYDVLDRLVQEQGVYGITTYSYDSMGNRLTKTENGVSTSYVYDLCNKLLSETTEEEHTSYSYDASGNLIEKVSNTGTTVYSYDALNQLTKVINPDGTWQGNAYDASGIRSMIIENGITTEYMTFDGMVLSGYNKNGEQTEHYLYGMECAAEELYSQSKDGEETRCYYLQNSHGDILGQTDKAGNPVSSYAYNAFGTLICAEVLQPEVGNEISRFLYAGEQYDEISGLYYLCARYYDTAIGRFTQEDTYLGDGRNLYAYVQNNPLKYVDPSGHWSYAYAGGNDYSIDTGEDFAKSGGGAALGYVVTAAAVVLSENLEDEAEVLKALHAPEERVKEEVETATGDATVAEVAEGVDAETEAGTSDGGCDGGKEEKADSKKLGKNMENNGMERPPYKHATHHIVAGAAKIAQDARDILYEFGIKINDAINGVFLPTEKGVSEAAYHPSLHTNEYYEKVNELIRSASSAEEVREILQWIAEQLTKGTFIK